MMIVRRQHPQNEQQEQQSSPKSTSSSKAPTEEMEEIDGGESTIPPNNNKLVTITTTANNNSSSSGNNDKTQESQQQQKEQDQQQEQYCGDFSNGSGDGSGYDDDESEYSEHSVSLVGGGEDYSDRYRYGDDDEDGGAFHGDPSSEGEMLATIHSGGGDDNEDDDDDEDFEKNGFHARVLRFFRYFILFVLAPFMILAGFGAHRFHQQLEMEDFEIEFDQISESIANDVDNTMKQCFLEIHNFGTIITALTKKEVHNPWPFFTDESFHVYGSNFRKATFARYIAIAPKVRGDDPLLLQEEQERIKWGNYSVQNQKWVQEGLIWHQNVDGGPKYSEFSNPTITENIFTFSNEDGGIVLSTGPGPFAPLWQMYPPPADPAGVINFDTLSNTAFQSMFNLVQQHKNETLLSEHMGPEQIVFGMRKIALEDAFSAVTATGRGIIPTSLLVHPLFADFLGDGNNDQQQMVGTVIAVFTWDAFFSKINGHHEMPEVHAVVRDNCGSDSNNNDFTMLLKGNDAMFSSYGDVHDPAFSAYEWTFSFAPYVRVNNNGLSGDTGTTTGGDSTTCTYTISLYPTNEFYSAHVSKQPLYIALVLVFVLFISSMLFCVYDWAVHSRQRQILAIASQSEKILSILYPKTIRDRLFGGLDYFRSDAVDLESSNETQSKDKPDAEDQEQSRITKASNKKSHAVDSKAARHQLKSFIIQDHSAPPASSKSKNKGGNKGSEGGLPEVLVKSKPIADLFPKATVMFGDIAGFTAWSSVREPSQVFTLLETIYAAFDDLAKRHRVFKVETVGDCYVAVTGLPEPCDDHAIIMCRFARNCLEKFNKLAGQLELTLGPDTGDLGIRIGLHSGPVTAGVLRGDRSRFQLFGDTVNTAARMESGGIRDKIQISMETAELVIGAGKGHWLERRDHVIEAKGKGKLQTYWLLPRMEVKYPDKNGNISDTGSGGTKATAQSDETEMNNSIVVTDEDEPEEFLIKTSIRREITEQVKLLNLRSTTIAEIKEKLPPKVTRLVDWNVDVLIRLLRQIVAKRNATGPRQNHEVALIKTEAELRMKCFVLDEVVEIIPLPDFDHTVHERQQNLSRSELPEAVVDQMRLYVFCIAAYYKDNPFHNFQHASHVMLSVSKLLSRIVAVEDEISNEIGKGHGLHAHDNTYGITSDPMTQFSVVLAALIHDVDHKGVSNFQLIKENHKLATLFKGKSVAEQNSIVLAWDILMQPRFHDLRRCIYADPDELHRFRQLITNTVLATDIFDKELAVLRKKRWEAAFDTNNQKAARASMESAIDNVDTNRKATIVIEHLIQASDVAHTMQHWHIYRKWNERLFLEMALAYRAGRLDKNPAEFWYNGELSFFDNYIIPLAKKLADCGVFGVSSDEYLKYAIDNRREWAEKGEEVVDELVRKFQSKKKRKPLSSHSSTIEGEAT